MIKSFFRKHKITQKDFFLLYFEINCLQFKCLGCKLMNLQKNEMNFVYIFLVLHDETLLKVIIINCILFLQLVCTILTVEK